MRSPRKRAMFKVMACIIVPSALSFLVIYLAPAIRALILQKTTPTMVMAPSSKSPAPAKDRSARISIEQSFDKLPLSFEVNDGQADRSVKFLSRGRGYSIHLNPTEAVLKIRHGAGYGRKLPPEKPSETAAGAHSDSAEVIRLKHIGSNPNPLITGMDPLRGKSNYFIGVDSSRWRTDISTYAKIKMEGVYPGIDLVYYGTQRQLEFDWIVAPGSDPGNIRFEITGKDDLSLDARGNLVFDKKHDLVLRRPVIYQQDNKGNKIEIAGHYLLLGKHLAGIEIGRHDPSLALVVDPVLSYSTYLGPSGIDEAYGIVLDSSDNVYIAGHTVSEGFPVVNAFQGAKSYNSDAVVFKFSPSRNELIYSTFLGGANHDDAYAIAVDSSGAACVTGATEAPDFPILNAVQSSIGGAVLIGDAFVTKLSAAGNELIFSTYLGGEDEDVGYGIAADAFGNTYVAGVTASKYFPTANPFQASKHGYYANAFVTKFGTDGALAYSTYLGGETHDGAFGIGVDSSGNAYVTGWTYSMGFPTVNPIQGINTGANDAFITKLSASGNSLIYSTFYGGSMDDWGTAIAVDSLNQAYVGGITYSADFPTKDAAQINYGGGLKDAFVLKVNVDGDAAIYSTYLGGSEDDLCQGLAVDPLGYAYVTGYTYSTDFPIANPIFNNIPESVNAFVSKLDLSGNSILYSTFLGGDGPDYANSIAVNAQGDAYVTGHTTSNNFPVVNAYQEVNPGIEGFSSDLFIAKISTMGTNVPIVTTSAISSICRTTAVGGGHVTSDNGAPITARGICWGTTPNPTLSDACTSDGAGTGMFASSITELTGDTTYHVRAYAANSQGTAYGTDTQFTTVALDLPIVVTAPFSSITQTSAITGGNVTFDRGVPVTARGVCWSTLRNPTLSDTCTSDGNGMGAFTSSITGLTASNTYYVRAYATNSIGTAYEGSGFFSTLEPPDFQIVDTGLGAPYSAYVTAGSSAIYNLGVAGRNGFSGSVSFSVSGLPRYASYSISPSPLSVSGSSAVPFKMTVSTTPRSSIANHAYRWNFPDHTFLPGIVFCLSGLIFMRLVHRRPRISTAFILLCMVGLAGCGGGSSKRIADPDAPPTTSTKGTPAGTYTLVLTATGAGIRHDTNLTLTVN